MNQTKKYVAITGATGGIGSELTKQLISKGFIVIGIDIDEQKLNNLKEIYTENFHEIFCDISIKNNLLNCCDEIHNKFGVPAQWYNNAGIAQIERFNQITTSDFDKTIDINFKATVYATRYWLDKMEEKGEGSIINMASVAGHLPSPSLSAYVSSKFAMVGFTQSLQMELDLIKSPVKLILVSPGFVETNIMQIGKQGGYPKQLKFIITKPESCVKNILKGVHKAEKNIWPTLNGNALLAMKRISPKLANIFSKNIINQGINLNKK